MDRFSIGIVADVPFVKCRMEEAVEAIIEWACDTTAVSVRFANAYSVACTWDFAEYYSVLTGDGVNFADGVPVSWLIRSRSATRSVECIRGPSVFASVIGRSGDYECDLRHFFLGGSPSTLRRIVERVSTEQGSQYVAGSYSPSFTDDDASIVSDAVSKILRSGANIVWVALGTPRQDLISQQLAKQLGIPCLGVGAAFDFYSGMVNEAPVFLRGSGFEWLYRLAVEPKRLWRRYTVGNWHFFLAVLVRYARSRRTLCG